MKHSAFILCGLFLGLALWLIVPAMGQEKPAPPAAPGTTDAPTADAPAPMTDIHDILPPVPVGIYAPWLLPVLLALATAAILAAAWWWWKKHRKVRQIETLVPELPPEMTAMRELDGISDVRRIDGKRFYFRLSAILRQYVFERFGVDAPEMTTEEFLPCIEALPIDKELARCFKSLCQAMDPVKFGGQTVVEKQMETDLFFARAFVRQTTQGVDMDMKMDDRQQTKEYSCSN